MRTAQPKIIPVSSGLSDEQRRWLTVGSQQPGGKLPLYDEKGVRISAELIKLALECGWAEPWANNPIHHDNLICRITESGRQALLKDKGVIRVDFSVWHRDTGESAEEHRAPVTARH